MKKSIEDELADSLGAEMRRTMDFEVIADIMITMRGYTRVEIDYDPNSDHWLDAIAWAGNNCLGDYKEHLGSWIFENPAEATAFALKWA